MKVVTEARWIFSDHGDLNDIFQKFTQGIRVVLLHGGFIPPSTSTPRSMAMYLVQCLMPTRSSNNLSFEESLDGISSVYTGTNGTLSFRHGYRELKSEFEINYLYNKKAAIAVSLEHLEALVSILGMPNSFNIEFTGEDKEKILSHEHINNSAAK